MIKRTIAFAFVISMVFCLSACSKEDVSSTLTGSQNSSVQFIKDESNIEETFNSDTTSAEQPTNSKTENKSSSTNTQTTSSHIHNYSVATCTTPKKCSCGATIGNALGHNYSGEKCSRCGNENPNYIKPEPESSIPPAGSIFACIKKFDESNSYEGAIYYFYFDDEQCIMEAADCRGCTSDPNKIQTLVPGFAPSVEDTHFFEDIYHLVDAGGYILGGKISFHDNKTFFIDEVNGYEYDDSPRITVNYIYDGSSLKIVDVTSGDFAFQKGTVFKKLDPSKMTQAQKNIYRLKSEYKNY